MLHYSGDCQRPGVLIGSEWLVSGMLGMLGPAAFLCPTFQPCSSQKRPWEIESQQINHFSESLIPLQFA